MADNMDFLMNRINVLKFKLEHALKERDILDSKVIDISRQLDNEINNYYRYSDKS